MINVQVYYVNAFAREHDLNRIAGGVLHRCSLATVQVFSDFVSSENNLADGPSRADLALMHQLHAEEVDPVVPDWDVDSLDWIEEGQ